MSYLKTAKGVLAFHAEVPAGMSIRTWALTRSRDRVQRLYNDRLDEYGRPRNYGAPGYNAKVCAKLKAEVDALNWAIEQSRKTTP